MSLKLHRTKEESHLIQENPVSTFIEYELPFTTFSTGISIIDGRYPLSGYDMDTGVNATWYIVSGTGRIFLIDTWYEVNSDDILFIPQGSRFIIEGTELKMVVTSSPIWTPEQHKHIDVL